VSGQRGQGDQRHALAGLRVVELSAGMAGPWIGRFMAWCGADVIKVESKKHPDVTRLYVPPREPDLGVQPTMSPWFTDWNAGKRFVALDLTRPAAVELARKLVATADVVVENYSAGVIDKLGLGYGELVKVKPDLVMIGSSGFGDSGPCRSHVTWGSNIEALSGLSSVSGFAGRECTITQYAYPDPLSAVHGLFAVMCALDHRRRTGQGQYINVSQFEATVAGFGQVMMEQLVDGRSPEKLGNRSPGAAPHGCYRCSGEDRWCAISVSTDLEWRALCTAIAQVELVADERFIDLNARLAHQDELDAIVESWTRERDAYDVMNALQAAGVAAGVVQNAEDLYRNDAQLAARSFFEQIPHPARGAVTATGVPLGLTGTPGRTSSTGSPVGHDTDHVFGELLGMSAAEIDRAVADGIIEKADK